MSTNREVSVIESRRNSPDLDFACNTENEASERNETATSKNFALNKKNSSGSQIQDDSKIASVVVWESPSFRGNSSDSNEKSLLEEGEIVSDEDSSSSKPKSRTPPCNNSSTGVWRTSAPCSFINTAREKVNQKKSNRYKDLSLNSKHSNPAGSMHSEFEVASSQNIYLKDLGMTRNSTEKIKSSEILKKSEHNKQLSKRRENRADSFDESGGKNTYNRNKYAEDNRLCRRTSKFESKTILQSSDNPALHTSQNDPSDLHNSEYTPRINCSMQVPTTTHLDESKNIGISNATSSASTHTESHSKLSNSEGAEAIPTIMKSDLSMPKSDSDLRCLSSHPPVPSKSNIEPLVHPFAVHRPTPRNPYLFPPPSIPAPQTCTEPHKYHQTLPSDSVSYSNNPVEFGFKDRMVDNLPGSPFNLHAEIKKENNEYDHEHHIDISTSGRKSLTVTDDHNVNQDFYDTRPFEHRPPISRIKQPLLPTPSFSNKHISINDRNQIKPKKSSTIVSQHDSKQPKSQIMFQDIPSDLPNLSKTNEPNWKSMQPPLMPPPHFIFSQPPPPVGVPLGIHTPEQFTSLDLPNIKKEINSDCDFDIDGQTIAPPKPQRPVIYSYADEISVLHNLSSSSTSKWIREDLVHNSNDRVDSNFSTANIENLNSTVESSSCKAGSDKVLPHGNLQTKKSNSTKRNNSFNGGEAADMEEPVNSTSSEKQPNSDDCENFVPLKVCPTPVRVKHLFSPPRKEWKPPKKNSHIPPPSPWQSLSIRPNDVCQEVTDASSSNNSVIVADPTHFGYLQSQSQHPKQCNDAVLKRKRTSKINEDCSHSSSEPMPSTSKSDASEDDSWNTFLSGLEKNTENVKFTVVEKVNAVNSENKKVSRLCSTGILMDPLLQGMHTSDEETVLNSDSRPVSAASILSNAFSIESENCVDNPNSDLSKKDEQDDTVEQQQEEALNFQDMVELLRNFTELEPEEQNAFSTFLRNLKKDNPEAIKKLYACANIEK